MEIIFLGTGCAIPTERKQSGVLLPEHSSLIDCGAGVLHNIPFTDVDISEIDNVLLSHLHSDHVNDVIPLLKGKWLVGEPELTIYGPPDTEETISYLIDAFDYLRDKTEVYIHEIEPGDSFDLGDMHIDTIPTEHSVESMGFRFDDSFVYTGDTEVFNELIEFSNGCDVLIHECAFPDEIDVDNHTRPSELSGIAGDLEVGRLIITHLYPQTRGKESDMIDTIRSNFDGEVMIADDLEVIRVN